MLKCYNIPKYQNISQGTNCPNTLKSKYVLVGKTYPSGQNVLIPPNCILLKSYYVHRTSSKKFSEVFSDISKKNYCEETCKKRGRGLSKNLTTVTWGRWFYPKV